jgi:hypothetical protein
MPTRIFLFAPDMLTLRLDGSNRCLILIVYALDIAVVRALSLGCRSSAFHAGAI